MIQGFLECLTCVLSLVFFVHYVYFIVQVLTTTSPEQMDLSSARMTNIIK